MSVTFPEMAWGNAVVTGAAETVKAIAEGLAVPGIAETVGVDEAAVNKTVTCNALAVHAI